MNKSLKWFLVGHFVAAIAFIMISEELLNVAYRTILPRLMHMLALENVTIDSEGSVLALMFQMVLYYAAGLLPEGIARWIRNEVEKLMAGSWQLTVTSPELQVIGDGIWSQWYQFGVLLIFVILFAVTLIPYMMAIIWYYYVVSGKVEELLRQQEEQKRENERARNLMLSDITHDIKTPITTICGYAKTLTDGVVEVNEEKRKEYLNAIYAKSMRMSELVTMLFEYVKMDSEGFALHKEPGDLGELLRENVAMLYTDFEAQGIELDIEIPEKPYPVEIDKMQMGRVIANILNNALKYNKTGTKVKVMLTQDYRIRIADNGAPIEEELAAHIFEPFSRGDKARSTQGGSGLGLSIAHKIVKMHGGSLTLDTCCADGYTKAFEINMLLK